MTGFLSVLSYITVFTFGLVLTAAFSGTLKDKKYLFGYFITYSLILIVQGIAYYTLGYSVTEMIYPLVTHLPLILFLVFYCKKTWSMAIASVAAAYLMTLPRHWAGSLASELFHNSTLALYLTQILVTFPLLFLVYRYIAPAVHSILEKGGNGVWQFSSFLIFYYCFEYIMAVYSKKLYSGDQAIIEFLDSAVVICYYIFATLFYMETEKRTQTEIDKKMLEIKVEQAQVTIDRMKLSYEQTAIYRHDLHHHLQYINATLENEDTAGAHNYIKSICDGITSNTIEKHCENETANMLLSSYVNRARGAGIRCIVKTVIPEDIPIPPVDLCVIIANAMENATRACSAMPGPEQPVITINAYTKNGRLFFELTNPYHGIIKFENNLPVADTSGHGLGTKSIVMTVEKHNGIWSFEAKDGIFVMRVVM